MTRQRLIEEMPATEIDLWAAYYSQKHKREAEAQKKAKQEAENAAKRNRPTGRRR